MAGAVVRASGSKTKWGLGSLGTAFLTRDACLAQHTTEVRWGVLNPAMRFMV